MVTCLKELKNRENNDTIFIFFKSGLLKREITGYGRRIK